LTITDLLASIDKLAPSVANIIRATQGTSGSTIISTGGTGTQPAGFLSGLSPTLLLIIGGVILFVVARR